jgi:hypothetical protein
MAWRQPWHLILAFEIDDAMTDVYPKWVFPHGSWVALGGQSARQSGTYPTSSGGEEASYPTAEGVGGVTVNAAKPDYIVSWPNWRRLTYREVYLAVTSAIANNTYSGALEYSFQALVQNAAEEASVTSQK